MSPAQWSGPAPEPRSLGVGLKLLLAAHLLLGTVPVAMSLVPPEVRFLPVLWALFSVGIGQLMVLSFWAGMGTSRRVKRLLGAVCGAAYVAIWPTVGLSLSPYMQGPPPITSYLLYLCLYCAMVLLFAGAFLFIRRRGTRLQRISDVVTAAAPARFQYSILHLLVITSIAAVVLGLVQSARAGDTPFATGPIVATYALTLVVFAVNTACAAWAALGPGHVRLRVFLVLLVAVLLGIALSLGERHDQLSWWSVSGATLVTVLPTVIVIISLLVVRSCGYRLISVRQT